jgi:hypothetical protein
MSTMTFLEQQQEVAGRLRLDPNNTDQMTLVKRWLNQSQQEIWGRYDWPWAFEREVVQTVVDKTDGTVSVSAGGTTVTGSSTAFAATDVGSFIQFESSDDWYKITDVASSTELTIEAAYVGTSALSDGTYIIRKMFYATSSSVEKILDVRQAVSPRKLVLVPYRKHDQFRPRVDDTGESVRYVPWGYDNSNRWTFTLDPFPDEVLNLEIRFKKKPTSLSGDSDVSVIPEKWHSTVMIDGALYRGLEYVRTSDEDKRAEIKQGVFENGVQRMIGDADPESDWLPVISNTERSMRTFGPHLPDDFDVRGS